MLKEAWQHQSLMIPSWATSKAFYINYKDFTLKRANSIFSDHLLSHRRGYPANSGRAALTVLTVAGSQFLDSPVKCGALVHYHRVWISGPLSSNKTIINGVKKRLESAKGKWVEELPHVLWVYRTTAWHSRGETPYSLTYGMKAVIPHEVSLPTLRSELFEDANTEEAIAQALDMAEGRKETALIRLVAYQQQLIKSFDKKVFPRQFTPRELVLRKVMDHKKVSGERKLGPNWEGPY
ncbi:uncharacterized protein LOC114313651 [Camellia sinensis]|uniref:uncharacterized protein LOC114313651 n=1 Tax=Camellia sinensis TaxID=4442 RepID=UPI001035C59B|nr:uncharacterized protein LOC114313651 [Camellia sinensis]